MIGVLNYKPFQRGSILGFFDLRYHGLTIKGCRLMTGANGFWFSFPQREGKDEAGNVKYFDIIYMTKPEAEHARRLVVAELEVQGVIQHAKPVERPKPSLQPGFATQIPAKTCQSITPSRTTIYRGELRMHEIRRDFESIETTT